MTQLEQHAQINPAGPAIVSEREMWTWERLAQETAKVAAYLDATLPAGATVIVQAWNDPRFIALREAVFATGRTFGAVSPSAKSDEVRHVLALTDAAAFLRQAGLHDIEPKWTPWEHAFAASASPGTDRRDAARALLLTSGTTGLPKACVRPVAADDVRMDSMITNFSLTAAQNHLVAAPLYHSGPSIFQRTHLRLGSTTYLMGKFDPAAVWAHVAAGHAHTAFFVPTHYHRLLRHDTGADASSIDTWWIAGAPAGSSLKEAVIKRIGDGKLWEFLGSSETGTMAVMPPDGHLRKPGSVGKPPPGVDVRILDDSGKALPIGGVGTIYVKSGMLMDGYLGEHGKAEWNDGFLTVGDLGYFDDEGYLYLSDRRTDLIITGGVNVYPAEVENTLLTYPGIHAAAVIGEADEEWGARVVAVLVGEKGAAQKLQDFIAEKLSPPKRPKRIEWWPSLPHNAIGKPLRLEVRRMLAEQSQGSQGS